MRVEWRSRSVCIGRQPHLAHAAIERRVPLWTVVFVCRVCFARACETVRIWHVPADNVGHALPFKRLEDLPVDYAAVLFGTGTTCVVFQRATVSGAP